MWRNILRLVLVLASHNSVSTNCVLGEIIHICDKINLLLVAVVIVEVRGRATSTTHVYAIMRCSACSTRASTDAASKVHITLKSVVLTATIISLIVVKS